MTEKEEKVARIGMAVSRGVTNQHLPKDMEVIELYRIAHAIGALIGKGGLDMLEGLEAYLCPTYSNLKNQLDKQPKEDNADYRIIFTAVRHRV